VSIILIILSIFNFLLVGNINKNTGGNLVINVIDGDTIVVNKGLLIRLHGIDAPDLEYCGGREAKQRLEELILDKFVSLHELGMGEYNRVLGLVYFDNKLINEILLKEGHAELFGAQTSAKEKLEQANQYARNNRIGIYDKCILDQPVKKECNIKGNIHARNKTKIYHLPECPNYKTTKIETFRGEEWFCTEEEAISAGFKKAENCP
jgi:endonuclease YncB( thermonuclease family)